MRSWTCLLSVSCYEIKAMTSKSVFTSQIVESCYQKLLKVYQLFGTIFHFCGHWHVWSQNFLLWNYAMTSNSVCFCNFSESCFVVLKNKHQKVIFIRKVEKIQYLSYDVQKNNDLFGVLAKAEKPFLLQMHIGRKID